LKISKIWRFKDLMYFQKDVKRIIFSEECPSKFRTQKRVHKLGDPRLRIVRHGFRVLLRLEYMKRRVELDKKLENLSLEYSRNMISYNEMFKKKRYLLKEIEELSLLHMKTPLGCGWCNNHMEDLVFDPRRQCWFCTVCYEYAHSQYPEEYP
jgi:hypothetical protein